MAKLLKILWIVNLILMVSGTILCETNNPRLVPEDYTERFKGHLHTLSLNDLVDLSLYFSGVQEPDFNDYQLKFAALIAAFKEQTAGALPSAQLAESIMDFMYSGKLVRYVEKQTRVDILLKEGTYNCVSSAVLFMILGNAIGLDVWGVKTSDHAFCRVKAGDTDYDVETTNRYGFNPGLKKEFTDEFGNITGFNYVPPGNYRSRTEIDAFELLSLILQNRITFLSEKRQYAEAVGLAVDYWNLLHSPEAYEVLINSFLNMWTLYNNRNQFTIGIEFYDAVIAGFGQDERLLKNRENLTHNYLLTLIESNALVQAGEILKERENVISVEEIKRFNVLIVIKEAQKTAASSYEQAVQIIKDGLHKYGDDKELINQKAAYVHNVIAEQIQKNHLDDAYQSATRYKAAGDLTESEWKKLLIPIYQKKANLYAKDAIKAASIIQEGLKEIGQDSALLQNYAAYIHNYEVSIHNQMVPLYNRKEYAQARALLEEALKQLPDSKRLKDDLEMIMQVSKS